jgi:hypothetical protein
VFVKGFRSGQREINLRVELLERVHNVSLEIKLNIRMKAFIATVASFACVNAFDFQADVVNPLTGFHS